MKKKGITRLLLPAVVLCAMLAVNAPSAYAQNDAVDEFTQFQNDLRKKGGAGLPGAGGQAQPPATGNATAGAAGTPGDLSPGMTLPGANGAVDPMMPGGMGGAPQTPEELQAMMEQEAQEQQRKIEEQTFTMALKQLMPLKPEQIRETLNQFRVNRESAETPLTVPEPRQEVQTLSLDPSAEPLIIRMAPNHVTSVSIVDATGMPWPIQDMSWAGPFLIQAPESGGNILRIVPQTAHGVGNISIRFVDMITPVTMRLTTGIDWVHYRLDLRIPKPGPLAKTPIIEYGGLKTVAGKDEQMVGVLDGTPPQNAEKLTVEGVDTRTTAYKLSGRVYLRTPLTLLSPAWDASVSSSDGTTVYALGNTPVVLLSDEGRMVKARIAAIDEVTKP
ncbi:MAG: DotH/IcmK family type IV secretion protein [Alphaproteobacteria bacterium]